MWSRGLCPFVTVVEQVERQGVIPLTPQTLLSSIPIMVMIGCFLCRALPWLVVLNAM